MEFTRLIPIPVLLLSAVMLGCNSNQEPAGTMPFHQSQQFRDYWHAGKAEVSSFELSQSRYGEDRKGTAVLIFVTEDLSKRLQVKLDNPDGRNKINVLKLNFTKNFVTGIYPYSLMLSVFTPVNRSEDPSSLKATMSSQEWCGQVYTQLNLRGNRYAIKSHSYFEQEADERFSVRQALLEDELWNIIRLDHQKLPVGELKVLPGLFHTRLNHTDLKVSAATGEKSETDSTHIYTLSFHEQSRKLSIQYAKTFPFRIVGWIETWEERGKTMQTSAKLRKTLFTDYWTKNKNEFIHLRDSLNLPGAF